MDEKEEVSSLSSSKEINKTYIISTMTSRRDEASNAGAGRLTLQRRNTNSKNAVGGDYEACENTENQSQGKRLTLQRRTRAGSTDKGSRPHPSGMTEKRAWTSSKILSEPNSRTGSAPPVRSASLRLKNSTKDIIKPVNTPGGTTEKEQKTFSTPTGKTQFERISLKKEVFEKLSVKDPPKVLTPKQTGVERQKQSSAESSGGPIPGSANKKFPIISQNRSAISNTRKTTTQLSTILNPKSRLVPCETRVSFESGSQTVALSSKELKMENSAVTVAVRVRPFSHR